MNIGIAAADQRKPLKYLVPTTIVSVLLAVLSVELLGINRLVRRFVQRDFVQLEVILVATLCAVLVFFVRHRRKTGQQLRILQSAVFGIAAGFLSGVVGMAGLSILNYRRAGLLTYTSSWSDLWGFVGISTLQTFGWLIGLLSAVYLTIMLRYLVIQATRQV